MAISGILITIRPGVCAATLADQLQSRYGALECAPARGRRLPAVLDCQSSRAGADLVRELGSLAAIEFIDVVFVDCEPPGASMVASEASATGAVGYAPRPAGAHEQQALRTAEPFPDRVS